MLCGSGSKSGIQLPPHFVCSECKVIRKSQAIYRQLRIIDSQPGAICQCVYLFTNNFLQQTVDKLSPCLKFVLILKLFHNSPLNLTLYVVLVRIAFTTFMVFLSGPSSLNVWMRDCPLNVGCSVPVYRVVGFLKVNDSLIPTLLRRVMLLGSYK